MAMQYYNWPAKKPAKGAVEIDTINPAGDRDPANYVPHAELVEAINVALVLGMPLLLTGEPGTGKTELARSVAWQLGLDEPLKFVAKSTSQSRDLFYHYDALKRLYDAQMAQVPGTSEENRKRARDAINYIDYAALGKALLWAQEKDAIADFIPTAEQDGEDRGLLSHKGKPRRAVVIIDEIDKAPRDFSNDLLDELENMRFRVPELRDEATPELDRSMRPVVLITSNSERQLPEAFMRRCLYFHIPFPENDSKDDGNDYTMSNIVAKRIGEDFSDTPMVRDALKLFYDLREDGRRLTKKPATAELLNWLSAMSKYGIERDKTLSEQPEAVLATLTALLKNRDDRTEGRAFIEQWLNK